LADLMWTWKKSYPPWAQYLSPEQLEMHTRQHEDMLARLPQAQVIVADNVCEYLYAGTDQEEWDFQKDFPCCAPPFDRFFVEMKRPTVVHSDVMGTVGSSVMPQFWGWYCEAPPISEVPELLDLIRDPSKCTPASAPVELAGEPEDYRWALSCSLFVGDRGRIFYFTTVVFVLSAEGRLMNNPAYLGAGLNALPPDMLRLLTGSSGSMSFPMLLALSFMNCKNVAVSDNEPRPLTPREERAGQRPWVRFKTLDIGPMRTVLRTEGDSDTVGLKRALHVCRGHFATYSEERPLFGKYAGRFWIPNHVRGSAASGTVVKDYRVNPS
jgi:hypothetical protein